MEAKRISSQMGDGKDGNCEIRTHDPAFHFDELPYLKAIILNSRPPQSPLAALLASLPFFFLFGIFWAKNI